jgi:hypothetical protein
LPFFAKLHPFSSNVTSFKKKHIFIPQKPLKMKNKFFTLSLIAFIFASCKKEYTCECKSTSTYPGSTPSTKLDNTPKMKKNDAIQKCNEGDGTINSVYWDMNTNQVKNYSVTTDCELK